MKASELISVIRHKKIYNPDLLDVEIKTLVNDTRQVNKGTAFVAIKGDRFDGHSAINEVVDKGAVLVIVEEITDAIKNLPVAIVEVDSTFRAQALLAHVFYGQATNQLNVIAVTGTNGKTTTASMISDLLEALNRPTGMIGTLHYKVANTYYPAVNTTPHAIRLQQLFHEMVEAGCQDAVIEASSHALALGRLWHTNVDCAIYTNLSREHLDFHHTMEEYATAKSLLFAQLGHQLTDNQSKLAIINLDDAYSNIMQQATSAEIVTYSLSDESATVYSQNIEVDQSGHTHFTMHHEGNVYQVELPMIGAYNVANYMAAFLCLYYYYQFDTKDILIATQSFKGVAGRMQVINEGQNFKVVVDFAHTAEALRHVMENLNAHKQGRLIVLMGHSGGNRDSGARPSIGDVLFELADYIVFTADNPRFESVNKIIDEMIQNHDSVPYGRIENRKEAIKFALSIAQPGDTVLFAGKGGEPYQIIGDKHLPYNEAEYVSQQIKRMEKEKEG